MEWKDFIEEEKKKPYYASLHELVDKEYGMYTCYPKYSEIYNAFKYTKYNDLKVVILGQDPYHGVGEANGLAFAVSNGIKLPPSLQNIYKELNSDLGIPISSVGNLECWAREGVLLLNTVLTVEDGNANSHSKCGWQIFTDRVIKILNKQTNPIVFMLWGKQAEAKKVLITNPNHKVLITSHPSPFSARRGFFGCNHFKLANEFLKDNGISEINWRL